MKIGVNIKITTRPSIPPYKVCMTASCPLPCRSKEWPGRTLSAVSSSGEPRKMLGMKSKKVWVIDIEAMKTANAIKGIEKELKNAEDATRIEATRFMCIPNSGYLEDPTLSGS